MLLFTVSLDPNAGGAPDLYKRFNAEHAEPAENAEKK